MFVLYDAAYPVSAHEISIYILQKGADAIRRIDIRHHFKIEIPLGLSGNVTLSRFQVIRSGLHRVTGAAVFIEAWKRLLTFKPLARLAGLPRIFFILERLARGSPSSGLLCR